MHSTFRLVWLTCSICYAYSAETSSAGARSADSMDLNSLSNEELENICSERGFELIKDEVDEETGELILFSREDYIEAARQCLLAGQHMEELVNENPALLQELEEERKRLLEEKQRLMEERKRIETDCETERRRDSSVFGFEYTKTFEERIEDEKKKQNAEMSRKQALSSSELSRQDSTHIDDFIKTLDAVFLSPLLQPIKIIVRRILFRLRENVLEVLRFFRRQSDAILGAGAHSKQLTEEGVTVEQRQKQQEDEL